MHKLARILLQRYITFHFVVLILYKKCVKGKCKRLHSPFPLGKPPKASHTYEYNFRCVRMLADKVTMAL